MGWFSERATTNEPKKPEPQKPPTEKTRRLHEITLADFMLTFKQHLEIWGEKEAEVNKKSIELLEFMKHYNFIPFKDLSK